MVPVLFAILAFFSEVFFGEACFGEVLSSLEVSLFFETSLFLDVTVFLVVVLFFEIHSFFTVSVRFVCIRVFLVEPLFFGSCLFFEVTIFSVLVLFSETSTSLLVSGVFSSNVSSGISSAVSSGVSSSAVSFNLSISHSNTKLPVRLSNKRVTDFKKLTPLKSSTQVQSSLPQKATPCAKRCHTTYRPLRSVHSFFVQLIFYPTPKILCFTMIFNWSDITKSAHYGGGGGASTYPCISYSLDSPDSACQTACWLIQPFSHSSRQRVPILYNGC